MTTLEIVDTGFSSSRQNIVAGTVQVLGVPVANRLVRICCRETGYTLRTVRTNKFGKFKTYVSYDRNYLLLSTDPNQQLNAVIQDNVVPK
ncbi:hypothetical protein [Acinetobacter junii]|uniref:hypothetical protein n=1 Tax=Acinetobacter junii TaxID=40215 RepID=UPI002447F169|nr:hypothetical protein [Acinetobacter junii]MDH1690806.1 hypothetical protein [Acinetobacter junii]